jgi:hypothetical protein
MSIENITILTSESLEKLRNAVVGNSQLARKNLSELVAELELSTVKHAATIETDLVLNSAQTADIPNMIALAAAINGLTPELATDERLWVSLAVGQFHDYTYARWGGKAKTDADLLAFWKLHVLASSTRNRWRDHSVSRLWWMHRYASMLQPEDPKAALDMLLIEIDFISSLLSKPSVSTNLPLAQAILRVAQEEILEKKALTFNRDKFRSFVRELDLIAGRRLLSSLESGYLRPIVLTTLTAQLAAGN